MYFWAQLFFASFSFSRKYYAREEKEWNDRDEIYEELLLVEISEEIWKKERNKFNARTNIDLQKIE